MMNDLPVKDDFDDEPDDAMLKAQLSRWKTPPFSAALTDQLIAQLTAELSPPVVYARTRWQMIHLLLIAQFRLFNWGLWVASSLVIVLGAGVTLAFNDLQALPLTLIAPVVTALGIAWVYHPMGDSVMEIEFATPLSPRLIVLARIMLIFGFNLGVALLCSLVLALVQSDFSLANLVNGWLVPMAFLSAMAFFLSVISLDPYISMAMSLTCWGVMVIAHYGVAQWAFVLPATEAHALILAGSVLLVAVGLWVIGVDERWAEVR